MKTQRTKWGADMGLHPLSPTISYYSSGRCQNADFVVCPYCGYNNEPDLETYDSEGSYFNCCDCDEEFSVDASFGYGFSTKPNPCKGSHLPVFSAQYEFSGEFVRISNCLCCEKQTSYHMNPRELLPWREEYNDPAYFDPDGVLDTGRTLEEQIDDRRHGPDTPVLTALFKNPYGPLKWRWDNALRAVEKAERNATG